MTADYVQDVIKYTLLYVTMYAYLHLYVILCIALSSCVLFAQILGGDQMTAARTRGYKRIRSNAERGKE